MNAEKVFVKSKNGNKLTCLVAKPEGKAEGLIVSSQGFGSTKERPQYQSLLNELPKLGFIIVVFEFQGLGESEGEYKEKTVTRDLEDLKSVFEHTYQNYEFNKEKVFLFGSSFGGLTALILALEDKRIKGLVLKAPVSGFKEKYDILDHKRRDELNYDEFVEDGIKYDVYSKASELNIPIKIIHGDKDESVPVEQSKKLIELCPNAELKIIEGEGHRFENKKQEVYSQIIKFFEVLK
ncbi:alpha/beta hydrolase [Candidatus Woesearchaeota archaeon]|nr:alpha/beta hydrolase [Candidatus Woesearchaeota archaeon]